VKAGQHTKNGWNFLPGDIQPFPFISACEALVAMWRRIHAKHELLSSAGRAGRQDRGVGQDGRWANSGRTSTKSRLKVYPQHSFCYAVSY